MAHYGTCMAHPWHMVVNKRRVTPSQTHDYSQMKITFIYRMQVDLLFQRTSKNDVREH